MSEKIKFSKPILNIDEKIKLLKEKRWLIIEDEEKAKHDLLHIWYFRLTWYFKFFQDKETNIFKEWTTFKQVVDLYSFDRKLRLLTLDAIEKIEISLKSNINYTLYKDYWAFWYLNRDLFYLKSENFLNIYDWLLLLIKEKQTNSSSIFVKNYFEKYEWEYLPSWMLFEELTIWEVSNIYRTLKWNIQKDISRVYWIDFIDLNNWIQLIRTIRNISAHQARLWNREYIIKLSKDDKTIWNKLQRYIDETDEVIPNYYNTTLVLNYLLQKINKNFSRLDDLKDLFNEYSTIDKEKMWFFENWELEFET